MKMLTPLLFASVLTLFGTIGVPAASPVETITVHTLVTVHRVWGTGEDGIRRLLLDDPAGRVISLARLERIVEQLDADRIGHQGRYHDITVELGDAIYVFASTGQAQMRDLGTGIGLVVGLQGSILVSGDRVVPEDVVFDLERSSSPLASVARLAF